MPQHLKKMPLGPQGSPDSLSEHSPKPEVAGAGTHPINSLAQLHSAIVERQDKLSKRLKQLAAWLLEHPNQAAFSTLAEIAESAGVHPSTLIRFANFFGFSGFSELQRLYKQDLLASAGNYQERVHQVSQVAENPLDTTPARLLKEFAAANLRAMELLHAQSDPEQLDAAVAAMDQAHDIYISGFRRAYSVAHYFYYALGQFGVRAQLVNASAGMLQEQLQGLDESSLLIAVTFKPYIHLTRESVEEAAQKGAKVLLITDSELCPVANLADHLFVMREAEVCTFRSLNATLCLAQALCVALGYTREKAG